MATAAGSAKGASLYLEVCVDRGLSSSLYLPTLLSICRSDGERRGSIFLATG